jgi:hypothetical protein
MAFLQKRTSKGTINLLVRLSRKCAELGGPLSRQLFNLVRDKRYCDVINFSIDYTWAFSAADFLYARQIMGLFEKQDFLDLGYDREAEAVIKFKRSEDMCRETNNRLDSASPNRDVNAVFYYASQKIAKILGDVPSIDSLDMSFGPGANTSVSSLIASARTKLGSSLECGMNLLPIVRELLEEFPHLAAYNQSTEDGHHSSDLTDCGDTFCVDVDVVPGKLAFVPKNCKTYRSIVVEPVLNGLIQKGIGTYMKRRLLFAGIDLSDQTRNQKLALKGSIDGSLATIDLSMASDCIARNLVWSLLPYDWSVLLDQCRSAVVSYEGDNIVIEKFSSMGNAYTFELESLIFFALTFATCQHLHISTKEVGTYGDDIICPVAAYDLLKETLDYCGFQFNIKKSFSTGPFRESCGADYLSGLDIRPFYLNSILSDRVLFVMHNWFMRHGEFALARIVFKYTRPSVRLFGPDGYGDGHLIGSWQPERNRRTVRAGCEGGTFKTYHLLPRYFYWQVYSDEMFPAYNQYVNGSKAEAEVIHSCMPTISQESDMYRVRGTRGYDIMSIYTLATTIFGGYCSHPDEV